MKSGLTVGVAFLLLASPLQAADGKCPAPTVKITSEAISASVEQEFEEAFRNAFTKVCAWWGSSYTGPFTVNIEDSRGPSMALLPGWRGQRGTMLFRSRTTERGQSAITHELVHVFAPNANRFLAEGLAVYAHEHLGGASAYPNFGDDLHVAAKEYADKADFKLLDSLSLPSRLETSDLDGKEAYIVAGSFVRFLVETYGMEQFRRLYAITPMIPRQRNGGEPGRWNEVYGKSLEDLSKEWKTKTGS